MKKFRIPIALILLLSILTAFSSCAVIEYGRYSVALASDDMNVDYKAVSDEDYKAFLASLQSFSSALSAELYESYGDGSNICFSPLSVYMALALAAETSKGQTRDEILSALGMTYSQVRGFTQTLAAFSNRSYNYEAVLGGKKTSSFQRTSNSVWIDKSISLNLDTAASLADNYGADIFSVPFANGEAARAIKKYIEDETHGLIDGKLDMDEYSRIVLLSTLYLKELWNYDGDELSKTSEKYDFREASGKTERVNLLEGYYNNGKAYETENYSTFFTETEHNYKLYFILPNGEGTLSDVFTKETISEILTLKDYDSVDDEKRQIHYTRVLFPEFSADFDADISKVLQDDFGIRSLFDENACDMSLISQTGEKIWCGEVIHRTELNVTDKGIEGAAVTAAMLAGSAGPPPYEKVYHDFVIDRSFGFILTDNYGTVLFSGTVGCIS